MKVNNKISIKIVTILIMIIVFVLAFVIVDFLTGNLSKDFHGSAETVKTSAIEKLYITENIPSDYRQLLNLDSNCCSNGYDDFQLISTINSNLRYPVSDFLYKHNYYVQICKITDDVDFSLSKGIIITAKGFDIPYLIPRRLNDESEVRFNYRADKALKPQKFIFLNLTGQNFKKEMDNDKVECYFVRVKNFSIKYDRNQTFDILGYTENKVILFPNYAPIEISFIKNNRSLYFLSLTRCSGSGKIIFNGSLLSQILGHVGGSK